MSPQSFLLDTNILICALFAPDRLDSAARSQLTDADHTVYFSTASIWEIAIKSSLNKANFAMTPQNAHALAIATGFIELTVTSTHTFTVAQMAWHHRDPFDRLMIAQAMSLPAYFLTIDTMLTQYSELVKYVAIK